MTEQKNNSSPYQDKEHIDAIVAGLTLFDDDLMSRVFDSNIKATELVLRIILGRDIRVISVTGQDNMKNAEVGGRNITLDVHAIDVDGDEMDIEVQGNSQGAYIRRARYHSSMIDSRMLKEGQSFKELKDSYVIFIYKHDKFNKGLPLYHIERYIGETKEKFTDGSHIIYVNGNYKGDDEVGRLMMDFHQVAPENMNYDILAEGVEHFKEEKEGHDAMCEAVENYAKEVAKECVIKEKIVSVQNLIANTDFTLDKALDVLGIQGEERDYIGGQFQK